MSTTAKKLTPAAAKKLAAATTTLAPEPVISTEVTSDFKHEEEHESVTSDVTIEYTGEPSIDQYELQKSFDNAIKEIISINTHMFSVMATLNKTDIKVIEMKNKALTKEFEKFDANQTKLLFQLFTSQSKVKKNKVPKTEEETKNLSINKEYDGLPHFIDFVKHEDGKTTFSRADVQRYINAHIKDHPELIVKYEIYGKEKKDTFALNGELGVLFDNIKLEMERRGLTSNEGYPLLLNGSLKYKDILRYVSYCLVPAPKKA
jgi:hypothetical protein